jgi:hypothetical protein
VASYIRGKPPPTKATGCWHEQEIRKGLKKHNGNFTGSFAEVCGITINCDLSGKVLDPQGYVDLYEDRAFRVALMEYKTHGHPQATRQAIQPAARKE